MDTPVIGQQYWLRFGTLAERNIIKNSKDSQEEYCGFCGMHRDDRPKLPRFTRLRIEIVSFKSPMTSCCGNLEEPPPGSFALRVLSGCKSLNGMEYWAFPKMRVLLALVRGT